ncbi:OmpA family protein [Halopseudomonas nanhaiensis]|uniref:OmpA family protein n=1 Tax=Halopseudomonas nanhaiensis TaxID=2830842 RepID=UPI001CBB86B0|nr:OmpA family protein [Halopseudomonas nanhaiensis]UAW99222.1 OmpA family protein [Halopseudomonas nanhaiensis]
MQIIRTFVLSSLVVVLSACASKAPEKAPEPPRASWADSRVADVTTVAEAQGFKVKREGEEIRVIIPVDGNFHPKRTLLLPRGLVPIGKVGAALKDDAECHFRVVGHSDSDGDEATNKKLALERAQAVANMLMLSGVSRKRMSLEGLGEIDPRADNSTPTGRELNRRVEIILTPALADTSLAKK